MSEAPARESFVIRVYRRSDEPGREVAGLVEVLARRGSVAFAGRDELWAVLISPGPRVHGERDEVPGRSPGR